MRDFILSLEKHQQAKIRRIFMTIEKYGLDAIGNHIKKLTGSPLWEIRLLGKDNIRILYVLPDGSRLLVLHGFTKKTQKTPEREIDMALSRYNEWLSS